MNHTDADPENAIIFAAAKILLASGPPEIRRLSTEGWDDMRLASERSDLIAEALKRSVTLRNAARSAAASQGNAVGEFFGAQDPKLGRPSGNDKGPSIMDSNIALEVEVSSLRRKLQSVELENKDLLARIPSRSDRVRESRARNKLRHAELEVTNLRNRVTSLETSTIALIEQLDAAKQERNDALEERDQASRTRVALEKRLGDTAARADYLRRLLPGERERIAISYAEMPDGKAKTRMRRRGDLMGQLSEMLDLAFPPTIELPGLDTEIPSAVASEIEITPAPLAPTRTNRSMVYVAPTRDWEVLPLGGGEEIGGSALLVAVGGRRILIDAGIRPNARSRAEMLPRRIKDLGDRLDAIVVTHAHADHAGYIPALADQFRTTPIICSPGTAALLPTMWRDSLNVMTNRSEAQAEWMETAPEPLYGEAHLIFAEEHLTELPFHKTLPIGDVDLTLFPAGHILGAAGVVLSADGGRGGRVVITGDISDIRQASVAECELPTSELIRGADLLVIESTNCRDFLPPRNDQIAELVGEIRDVVVNGRGRVLIPAFALGRAQEVALILAEHLPEVPVLIDGLARQISTIYELFGEREAARVNRGRVSARASAAMGVRDDLIPPAEVANPVNIFSDTVQQVPDRGRYRSIKGFTRGVVITTSGMLTGGPAVQWAREILPEQRDALFLCGYQDEEAPGRRLAELARGDGGQGGTLSLLDYKSGPIEVQIKARIRNYRLSAHADKGGLMNVVDQVAAREVMLVHGVRGNQDLFRRVLNARGQNTVPTDDWRRGPR